MTMRYEIDLRLHASGHVRIGARLESGGQVAVKADGRWEMYDKVDGLEIFSHHATERETWLLNSAVEGFRAMADGRGWGQSAWEGEITHTQEKGKRP